MYAGGLQTGYDGSAIAFQESGIAKKSFDRNTTKANPSEETNPATDRYIPSENTFSGLRVDDATAIRSGSDPIEKRNCYCGNCSICRQKRLDDSTKESPTSISQEITNDKLQTEAAALSEAEQREVDELKQRDAEVRAHEQAHAAAGAGNVNYTYQTGPDGKQYAIGGSADMQVSAPAGDAKTKMEQARKLRAAAMAPAAPSPTDYAVAAKADRIIAEARQEARKEEVSSNEEERDQPATSSAAIQSHRDLNETTTQSAETPAEQISRPDGGAPQPTPSFYL